MNQFEGKTLSWRVEGASVELSLHREPCNEIGSVTLSELELFAQALKDIEKIADALIIYSKMPTGFCAGADLRELYERIGDTGSSDMIAGVRDFLQRIHNVMNAIDSSLLTTIAAVNGLCFGGGFELALTCDLIIADKMARFCFPELRLGLIPGFGGIPRLKRDIGNGVVRDLLLTGRSIGATKALNIGLVSQVAAEGEAITIARSTAAQIKKFDRETRIAAKKFVKTVPYTELRREIEIFCQLLQRPAVEAGLKRFVESTDALPYLPG